MVLHQEFIRRAKHQSNKTAIIDRSSELRFTYMEALVSALVLADRIARQPDRFIGVMIPNSAGSAFAILAALMAGKVPVMINYATGVERNSAYAQAKCGFETIITSQALIHKLGDPEIPGVIFLERIMQSVTEADRVSALKKAQLPLEELLDSVHGADPDDNAVILFTSGSEKDPKAVQLTHRNIGDNLSAFAPVLGLNDDEVVLANLPFFHVFGQTVDLWMPLCDGMTIVTVANPLDYRTVCKIIREEKITFLASTPTFLLGYLRQSEPGDFASVRIMVAGADKVPDGLRQGMMEKHGKLLLEGYGTTETSPAISVNTPSAHRPGSTGRALPNVEVRIADIDTDETLPPEKEGRILVKGTLVMKGYLNDSEETSRRIKDGWYDTGDMGMLDKEGFLWHRGRLKRFVKIAGEMISLVKVESVLASLLPEGVDCCVVEAPDRLRGSRILAVVTREIEVQETLRKMAAELPRFALPKEFILVEEMPKMGSGKINFRALAAIAAKPGTDDDN
jgi:acyl-[acyl-carrier-protein]-phospholipid O-acyltransferase / long-chain-fatty-acid--[acyl-carrier-protein] ligase